MKHRKKPLFSLKEKIIWGTLFFGSLFLGVCDFKAFYLSEKITSQSQLEMVIDEEKEKLGISQLRVRGKILDANEITSIVGSSAAGFCDKNYHDESYEIALEKNCGDTRDGVAHELYHIARGCLELEKGGNRSGFGRWLIGNFGERGRQFYYRIYPLENSLSYFLVEEPLAVTYSGTGISLGNLPLSRK